MILLLLDDHDGTFARVPRASLDYALAGAVLMELALENRIDTDLDRLVVVDATPLEDGLLDPTLADIAEDEGGDARYWVQRTANRAEEIRELALDRLVEHGILERRDERFLWVFESRRYPMIEGEAEREVKLRIMEVLFSDVIPDPRDVVIISLAHACGIFDRLLSRQEVQNASARIRAGAAARPHQPGDVAGHRRPRGLDRLLRPAAPLLSPVPSPARPRPSVSARPAAGRRAPAATRVRSPGGGAPGGGDRDRANR